MNNEYLWCKLEYEAHKQRKANKSSLSGRLLNIVIGLLAGIAFISAVYYLSLWRW